MKIVGCKTSKKCGIQGWEEKFQKTDWCCALPALSIRVKNVGCKTLKKCGIQGEKKNLKMVKKFDYWGVQKANFVPIQVEMRKFMVVKTQKIPK